METILSDIVHKTSVLERNVFFFSILTSICFLISILASSSAGKMGAHPLLITLYIEF